MRTKTTVAEVQLINGLHCIASCYIITCAFTCTLYSVSCCPAMITRWTITCATSSIIYGFSCASASKSLSPSTGSPLFVKLVLPPPLNLGITLGHHLCSFVHNLWSAVTANLLALLHVRPSPVHLPAYFMVSLVTLQLLNGSSLQLSFTVHSLTVYRVRPSLVLPLAYFMVSRDILLTGIHTCWTITCATLSILYGSSCSLALSLLCLLPAREWYYNVLGLFNSLSQCFPIWGLSVAA